MLALDTNPLGTMAATASARARVKGGHRSALPPLTALVATIAANTLTLAGMGGQFAVSVVSCSTSQTFMLLVTVGTTDRGILPTRAALAKAGNAIVRRAYALHKLVIQGVYWQFSARFVPDGPLRHKSDGADVATYLALEKAIRPRDIDKRASEAIEGARQQAKMPRARPTADGSSGG